MNIFSRNGCFQHYLRFIYFMEMNVEFNWFNGNKWRVLTENRHKGDYEVKNSREYLVDFLKFLKVWDFY